MSFENDGQSSVDKADELSHHAKMHSRKVSYSREFLLTFSELEICKKLPSDFDASILSEFEDASYGTQGQQIPGSSPLLSYRRSEYGSSPPTRGDSSNYSRSGYGRWESRSSGCGDRDSDSQSDRSSDSGRRHGNPIRRSWQSSEHDGLLGSGLSPRHSGFASGSSLPKPRVNDHCQLSRSTEPYHPPRPYKAAPHSRRDAHDSFNDETFGSSEITSEDREEEERRRRACFEMMRKEQQKTLQEKQKKNLEKRKTDDGADIFELLVQTKDEKRLPGDSDAFYDSATPAVSTIDAENSSILSHTTASRPLVPPGFASGVVEKKSGLKSSICAPKIEVVKHEPEESLLRDQLKLNGMHDSLERQPSEDTTSSDHHSEDKTLLSPFLYKGEKVISLPLSLGISDSKLSVEDHIRTSRLLQTHESFQDPEIFEIRDEVSGSTILGESNQNRSTSILEKIFDSALPLNVGSSMKPVEQIDTKPDDMWTPNPVQSSKFAHWFLEEERKQGDDLSFGRPNNLLSLIVAGDKGKSQLSEEKATMLFPTESSHENSELATKFMSKLSSKANSTPELLNNSNKPQAVPAVLTCEDLEQSILSEYNEKSSDLQPTMQGLGVGGRKAEQPRGPVDNHASEHLLSLLQKGTSLNQMPLSLHMGFSSDKILVPEAHHMPAAPERPREEDVESTSMSGKTLTLETLFGSAFMKELQSVDAPVSVQRGSVGSAKTNGSEPLGLSFPLMSNGHLPLSSNEVGASRASHQNDILPSNHIQDNRPETSESWLGIGDSRFGSFSSKHQIEASSKQGLFAEAAKFHLPEEESLIAVGDPLNLQNSKFIPAGSSSKGHLSSTAPIDIANRLANIGTDFKEQSTVGPEGSPFAHGHFNRIEPEIPHRNLHVQPSSPQFPPQQMGHGRPLLYPLDSHPAHVNSQMKFLGPESMIHHEPPANHQFPASMIRPPFPFPNAGVRTFDHSAQNQMLPQMQISGNYAPRPLHDFQRSAALSRPLNPASTMIPELNPMQGLPFGTRQQNIGGLGMPFPARDINSGSDHPEAFQRLLEMEHRAKSQPTHPLSVGHSQPMYGNELDKEFRYR